jgi:DNA-binding transcriptional ArsR family regulator
MDVFTAIADPTRREVLDLLCARERAAGELAGAFPRLSQPAISRHLRVLREAGLVKVRRDQQRRVYSLKADGLAALDSWLARYRQFWSHKLDSLSRHLDARAKRKRRKRR